MNIFLWKLFFSLTFTILIQIWSHTWIVESEYERVFLWNKVFLFTLSLVKWNPGSFLAALATLRPISRALALEQNCTIIIFIIIAVIFSSSSSPVSLIWIDLPFDLHLNGLYFWFLEALMEAIVALTADTFVFVFVFPCVFTFVFLILPCNLWQVGHLEADLVRL